MGLSGQFVLKGTNSSMALVIVGTVFLIIDIIRISIDNNKDDGEAEQKDLILNEALESSLHSNTETAHSAPSTDGADNATQIIRLTDENYYETIADNSRVVVCFCDFINSPSKMMFSMIGSFAKEYQNRIKFGIYDVYGSHNEKVREANDITVMPTLLFFKDGQEEDKLIGVCPSIVLKEKFEKLLV